MKKLLALVTVFAVFAIAPATASAGDDRVRARVTADGGQEATPVDTEMTGRFRVEVEDGEIEFRLRVEDNSGTIVAAHIHCAAPGVNGPVGLNLGVEPFTSEEGEVVRSTVTSLGDNGCGWTSADDVAAAIEMGAAYVNIHTLANRGGEIRGNLTAR